MTGPYARYGGALLGVALIAYALTGFRSKPITVAAGREIWLGPVTEGITGLITAATGVFVVPSVLYLQALNLGKEELIQALGLTFTVSTVALAINLAFAGALNFGAARQTFIAVIAAFAGMWPGQVLRTRLSPEIFRRCFFAGLLLWAFISRPTRCADAWKLLHRKIKISFREWLTAQSEMPPLLVIATKAVAAHRRGQYHTVGVLFRSDRRVGGP
jgi:hypothetical protein